MVVADYFKTIEQLLGDSKLIVDKTVDFKEFSSNEGMARGRLLFLGGYDNAAHHKEISTFPHHKHVGTEIKPSKEIGLAEVLSEIESMILTKI